VSDGPHTLQIRVRNAVGQEIPGATVAVVVRRGVEWREDGGTADAPVTHALREGFIQIEIDARAPGYVAERAVLTFGVSSLRWESTNPAWALREDQLTAVLDVVLGRVRFAPIVALSDTQRVPATFVPNAVLVDEDGYRTVGAGGRERSFRVLRQPATGDVDDGGWDRFVWDERDIALSERGNWLILEYGDPSGRLDAWRQLLGVWAPHSTPLGARPPVIIQITPNTNTGRYPGDTLPFTGLYPYGCLPRDGAPIDAAGTVALRDARQAYVELTSNRSFGQYKIVYQLYAARPDLFEGSRGPIVITLSPAFIPRNGLVLRDPFVVREAMGRLVAEVLRFLWSRKLTLGAPLGSMSLRYRPPEVALRGARPVTQPDGFPRSVLTTVVCHSAGVEPVLALAGHERGAPLPRGYSAALFGGANGYCDDDWNNLWVIDGVRSPGGVGVPAPGSAAVRTWTTWLKGYGRRLVCVYTPSGLGPQTQPGLLTLTKPRLKGKTGWIEEGFTQNVSWMRCAYEYVRKDDPTTPTGVLPGFDRQGVSALASHNKIYEFGVGYAARLPPGP
jgi:hypothetical protein